MDISISIAPFNSALQKASIALRRIILRSPLGLDFTAEELANEHHQIHIVLAETEQVLGVVLLQIVGQKTLKMRQFAIDGSYQNKGLGKKLVCFAEEYAMQQGFSEIELHARETAAGFYTNCGYDTIGELFFEVGIPHYKMIKKF